MLPSNVLYYGQEEPLPVQRRLRAGPLSLIYEAGDLRYIKLGEREILRRVYVAIRDRNWNTIPALLSHVQMNIAGDSFQITFDAENRERDTDFFWRGKISGQADGTIRLTMDGVARSTFLRNRIGFCVLHPIQECAGRPCRVEKVDGSVEESEFPRYISPHQPFREMRAIAHQVMPGLWATVRFEGDTFEMEDQRNWTDASYKTYSTPLALPFPVEVKAGARISQAVTLTLAGQVPAEGMEKRSEVLTFIIHHSPSGPLPRIGLGVASHGQPLSREEIARLRALHLSHLRVDLDLARPDWATALRRAAAEARALGAALEVALFLTDDAAAELEHLVALLPELRPEVCAWLVFHRMERSTTAKWVELARRWLAKYDPAARIGAGTNAYFAELNRGRPPVEALDLVCYSVNPQVHAFDNASLVENLSAQAATVESARQFCGGLPLAITPITLKPRFNPNATGLEQEIGPGELPPPVDVRQMSLFGAGWTAGSLKYVAESGVASVTYYETTGWRGVMERADGSPLPERFRSCPGGVFPLYHVLADVGELTRGQVIPSVSSDPLRVDGLVLRHDGRSRVILANLSGEPQQVTVQNLTERVRVRFLDETNAKEAMRSPETYRARAGELVQSTGGTLTLSLRPYAVLRMDDGDLT